MKKLLVAGLLLTGLNAETYIDVQKRCYEGKMLDCYNLAHLYQSGTPELKQNFYRASRQFRNVCDAGTPKDVYLKACYNLGFIYFLGNEEGVIQNYNQAIKLFSKACDGGEEKSCYQLGNMYSNGAGVEKNHSTAKKYYKKACDLGEKDGCKEYSKGNKK